MTLWGSQGVRGRRVFMAIMLTTLLAGAPGLYARGQDPAKPAAPPAPPDQLTFSVDTMALFFTVDETGTTDFEAFMGKVKEVLSKSEKPDRKQQSASWKTLLKVGTPQNGVITYLWLLDPVAKGVSYDLFKLLAEGLPPDEVQALYKKVSPLIKGISTTPVRVVGAPAE